MLHCQLLILFTGVGNASFSMKQLIVIAATKIFYFKTGKYRLYVDGQISGAVFLKQTQVHPWS